ncbi:hypothetical protein GCM10012275_29080 [Longimycelium tulufanense]|uniref:NAD-dependent epimerase/dehydratase domain-containing protein n=1 Tax=Longimycelium tulufanense TaxID=907463 RepID=A0A8J3FWU2_9PSEU|nr:NAD(P)-dependent oxidoreductase [Longimycelium tulufanense]GGM56152.1 hypothetical protein GCM10012275_29080 [Longimycelium tulufanense]
MTRYLLLGASGFLGRHVWDRLVTDPEARLLTAGRRPVDSGQAHLRLDLATAGVRELGDVLAAANPDVVINAAGMVGGTPAEQAAVNTTAVGRLAEAMLRTRPTTRLVHIGSAAEYGRVRTGIAVAEDTPAHPVAAYGVTKLGGTQLLRLARVAGLDAVVLRVFNPVGPGIPEGSLLGRLVRQLRDREPEIRLGPLGDHRDFVDARDVANAVVAAARVSTPRWLINVGSGRATQVRELVRALLSIAGHDGPLHEAEPPPDRSALVSWQAADLTVARRVLGWRPTRTLTTTLTDVWREVACPFP